ncbi:hypothetical protein B9Z19DRAFT_1135166 [Tuber borchii]|uniref:Uncharacterized protein n=1 Tax=Tuber borchii TaxID=42251 RepID=A0A2T6ZD82_TUBBO|nr:hypothetical protein B9Z19DRAFT_1135166 [Tuber borchii]
MSFSKSPTHFTTTVRTGIFRHPTYRIRTPLNRGLRSAINHAQQRSGSPITMLRHSASLMRHEARSLKLSLEQHAQFREQDTLRSQKQQATLFQHFEDQLKHCREQQDALLKHFQDQEQQYQKRVEQKNIQNRELLCAALEERTERLKLQGRYNACGALERIVYQAKLEKKIPPTTGIQEGLGKLAEGREFTDILEQEVKARRRLDLGFTVSFENLYHNTSWRTNGNDGAIIIVEETTFPDNDRAALVCLLKLQSSWLCPLPWKEKLHEFPKGGK